MYRASQMHGAWRLNAVTQIAPLLKVWLRCRARWRCFRLADTSTVDLDDASSVYLSQKSESSPKINASVLNKLTSSRYDFSSTTKIMVLRMIQQLQGKTEKFLRRRSQDVIGFVSYCVVRNQAFYGVKWNGTGIDPSTRVKTASQPVTPNLTTSIN
jgi:hypothetical protein